MKFDEKTFDVFRSNIGQLILQDPIIRGLFDLMVLSSTEDLPDYMKKEKSNKEAVIKELSEHIDAIFSPLIRELESLLKEEEKKVEELLPCPFCGCSGMLFCRTINDMQVFFVECTNGHSLSNMSNTKEEAIKKWNERV